MLDEDIATYLDPASEMPVLTLETLATMRAGMSLAGKALPAPPIHTVADFDADGVPVRLYRPRSSGPLPLLVFLHGGGWLLGDLDTHDAMCRHLANRSACAVLAVGYRLAPEHPFPAGLDDADVAWTWALREAARLGCDPALIALGGESAGGNLAAAMTLRLRDSGHRQPLFQVLVHPATELNLQLPSFDEVSAPGLSRDYLQQCVDLYLGKTSPSDPLASPLRAASHCGLAPAIIITAAEDPLRDDGECYARVLAAAGVETLTRRLPGLPHGFLFLPSTIPAIDHAFKYVAGIIRDYFAAQSR